MKILISPKDRLDAIRIAVNELISDNCIPRNQMDAFKLMKCISEVCEFESAENVESKKEAIDILVENIVISF